ncbi:hypothetical protein THMIRHAS_19920 [Thiosulfatimonas sediminis]|uniref:Nucleotide-diphospho-sugar transferase domain-containing protein n=1 Tax=Thiosulfatimonas sediminis TaxID=2675054 RepID=A0A6F8PWX3_9GAMM|nr:putative nucleotide-diphospho-sugar transferase [Thiosulfatimonas sediminis]BBP46619.1 hypothetical protein THMIRHAS_19920 [Thiosulfatimonas sediminis]
MLKIIGFYTDDALYSEHARLMKASLVRFGLEPYLEKVSADEWQKIIAFKPEFIHRACQKFPNDKILYIDADAFVHADLRGFFADVKEDIAVHYFQGKELASGTLFINNTPSARALVNEWVLRMRANPKLWDQKVLEEVVADWKQKGQVSIKELGPEFTYIYDLTPKRYGLDNLSKPLVEHLQASREHRLIKQIHESSALKRLWVKSLLNRHYRRIVNRRKVSQALAQQVNIILNFPTLD